jgi:hypothetical protein
LDSDVPERSPVTVLVEPGTTVLPVAPGTVGFLSTAVGVLALVLTSPVFMPAAVEFAVGEVAVLELLLPVLPAGLLLWAKAASGAAKSVAVRIAVRIVEVISSSLCGREITAYHGYSW